MSNDSLSIDTMLQHGSGLRRLARSLLADEHTSEDVVQDTWTVALEHPPATAESLGGWLRRVTRSLALNQRRGQDRRVRRELVAAPEIPTASVDAMAAHREILREVVEAVLSLREPYQTVVILRYYQDLSAREIAARRQLPVATVDSQLHRARKMLRARLERDSRGPPGAWQLALALAIGTSAPPRAIHPHGTAAGGTNRGIKFAVAGIAAAILGGVAFQQARTPGRTAVQARPTDRSPAAATGAGADAGAAVEGAAKRVESVGSPRAAALIEAFPPGPHRFRLTGTVVDARDRPVRRGEVFLAPIGHPLNRAVGVNAEGAFAIEWTGPDTEVEIAVLARGYERPVSSLLRLTMRSGAERTVRLIVHSPVPEPEGSPAMKRLITIRGAAVPLDLDAVSWSEQACLESTGSDRDEMLFRWCDDPDEIITEVQEAMGAAGIAAGPRTRIHGTIFDAHGRPVPAAWVFVDDGEIGVLGLADESGQYEATVRGGASIRVRGGGGDLGIDLAEVGEGLLDLEITQDLYLDRGHELRGVLRGDGEDTLAGWEILACAGTADTLWFDSTTVGERGLFALPNVPPGEARLMLRRHPGQPFADRMLTGLVADREEFHRLFDLQGSSSGVRIALLAEDGTPVSAEVQLWQQESGLGTWLTPDEDGYGVQDVPPGAYELLVISPERGTRVFSSLRVEGGAILDLGAVTLDPPAGLELEFDEGTGAGAKEVRWSLFRRERSGHSLVAYSNVVMRPTWSRALAAGDYELFVFGSGFAAPPEWIHLSPGETITHHVDLETDGETRIGSLPTSPTDALPADR